MRFAIIGGLPYLIHDGMAYPVEIKGGAVTVDRSSPQKNDAIGRYTLGEIHAKCGQSVSSIVKKPKANKKGGVDE